jgi:hypothetical protein
MTKGQSALAASSVQLSKRDRRAILDNVLVALKKRFYRPDKLNDDWMAAVERHRPLVEGAETAEAFEQSMSDLLAELHIWASFTTAPAGLRAGQR